MVGIARRGNRSHWGDRSSPRLGRPVLDYLGLFGPLSSPLNFPRKIFVTLRPMLHLVLFPCYRSAGNSLSMFIPTVESGCNNHISSWTVGSPHRHLPVDLLERAGQVGSLSTLCPTGRVFSLTTLITRVLPSLPTASNSFNLTGISCSPWQKPLDMLALLFSPPDYVP